MKMFGWVIVRQAAFDELARRAMRIERVAEASPLTREQILAGLERGPQDKTVKSVCAIVRGLREIAVRELAEPSTTPEQAAVLRGQLGMAQKFEQMLAACWGDLERTRKALEKGEKNSG